MLANQNERFCVNKPAPITDTTYYSMVAIAVKIYCNINNIIKTGLDKPYSNHSNGNLNST